MLKQIDLSPNLERLEDLLLKIPEPGLMLSEVDGLLCAVIVGPEPVPPDEWLPMLWDGGDFDDDWGVDLAELTMLVNERHATIVEELSEGRYAPLYSLDTDDTPIWEIWMDGFEIGMGLCLKAWERLLRRGKDEHAVEAALGFVALLGLCDPQVTPNDSQDPEVLEARLNAPETIPLLATILYRAHTGRPVIQPIRSTTVGRNDPCPCGSGLKYKRCHGAT